MRLIVKDPGCSFTLPRVGLVRTPCNIEISGVDINLVIVALKMNGLSKYQIVEDEKPQVIKTLPKNTKIAKAKKPEKVIVQRIKDGVSSKELSKLNRKFELLMDGMNKLMEGGSIKPKKSFSKTVSTGPKIESLDDDEFVPEISLDGMEISDTKSEEIYVESDISESADILRELKGDKE